MEIIKIEYLDGNQHEMLLLLKGTVFHLTTLESYKSISKCGMICNNKDGRFNLNTASQNSFGKLAGCVCLVDLRDKDEDAINDILGRYYFLGPTWFEQYYDDYSKWNLAYLILSPEHYEKLIPYEKAIEHYRISGTWPHAIPHAETWISDHVPLEWISRVYLVRIRQQAPAKGTHARALYEIERDMRESIQTANNSLKRDAARSRRAPQL